MMDDFQKRMQERDQRVSQTKAWLDQTVGSIADGAIDVSLFNYFGTLATFKVRCQKGELGKIIGKDGRTVRALRALLLARGGKDRMTYEVDIEDPGAK